jgi:hypothetical protein
MAMPKSLGLLAIGGLACLWPAAATADGPYGRPLGQRPPSGVVDVSAGGESLIVWPYTTDDFVQPSDPINLLFPNADPRAIRQELMKLEGDRPFPYSLLSIHDCRWTDALGDEQAAFGRPERWVGGAVQLACAPPGAPLGVDFRVHMRLFRIGKDTIGGVHLDFLIPGTAEHETLSWDFPRSFVLHDMGRTGAVVASVEPVAMIDAGTFRAVRRPIYEALVAHGAGTLLGMLGLVAPANPTADVPIPTDGHALAFVTAIDFAPARTHVVTTTQVTYDIVVPKPFCAAGPADYVRLKGPLQFLQSVSTEPSGLYERTYSFGGTLRVTPVGAPGQALDASIFEIHRARLDDRRGEVTWDLQQSLLSDPPQSLRKHFAAGDFDTLVEKVVCGTE